MTILMVISLTFSFSFSLSLPPSTLESIIKAKANKVTVPANKPRFIIRSPHRKKPSCPPVRQHNAIVTSPANQNDHRLAGKADSLCGPPVSSRANDLPTSGRFRFRLYSWNGYGTVYSCWNGKPPRAKSREVFSEIKTAADTVRCPSRARSEAEEAAQRPLPGGSP